MHGYTNILENGYDIINKKYIQLMFKALKVD